MVLIRRSSLLAAGLLLLIAAPAYAARGHGGPPLALGDILGIGHAVGSVFGTIGHAVLGAFSWTFTLATNFILTTIGAIVKLLIPPSWAKEGVEIMRWIVAIPDYAGTITSPTGQHVTGSLGSTRCATCSPGSAPGCSWQTDPASTEQPAVCLLDVPVNKTGTPFTKPVDGVVGEAIEAWEQTRPPQPRFPDRKTGQLVDFLFAFRGARIGATYVNRVLLPMLSRKAGVPREDVRGAITGHRARATIASQLYNAKDPMTLFELQAWLGHSCPSSTQHYARITPTKLTKAYTDAGYFARNVRTIEVLLDRDAITNGQAGNGGPFEFYDLGHGYCSYSFFEQCPHRMACARCDFYLPKPSSEAQLLEAKDGLQRMLAEIPLTDEERAAVEGDQTAVGRLIDLLADTPTPAGHTPRQISAINDTASRETKDAEQ
jgi:hypothetical protein